MSLSSHFVLFIVVAMTRVNANVMIILSFLYCVVRVLEDYFDEVVEEAIIDNMVLIYELLDELMDFGYPQLTETQTLKDYITVQEKHRSVVLYPRTFVQYMMWRGDGIVYNRNEISINVTEKLDTLLSARGEVLRSEIIGSLRIKSSLSGIPKLVLALNDKLLLDQRSGGYDTKYEPRRHARVQHQY